jgi:hypothetical protein
MRLAITPSIDDGNAIGYGIALIDHRFAHRRSMAARSARSPAHAPINGGSRSFSGMISQDYQNVQNIHVSSFRRRFVAIAILLFESFDGAAVPLSAALRSNIA